MATSLLTRCASTTRGLVGAAVIILFATAGCREVINPWMEDLPATDSVTTASAEVIRSHPATSLPSVREWPPSAGFVQSGATTHWPLWWQDPFADKGSDDGRFAWTWEDYVAMPYGLARFLLNTMAWPVSATVEPAWMVMGSDGVLSRQALGKDHDPEPLPTGAPVPVDILEAGTIGPPGPDVEPEEPPPAP